MNPNTPNYIEKSDFSDPSEDFDALVAKGIELLQKLTGHTWTDYNLHDPGITILEQLCFAFTDLSYRTGFDIKDILSDENGKISRAKNSFFDKKQILSTSPITINDFKKLIIDEIDEVDNVDIIPVQSKFSSSFVKGFYKIIVKLKDYLAEEQKLNPNIIELVEEKIKKVFIANRNLGENTTQKIYVLNPQPIGFSAEIQVKEFVHPEQVLTDIFLKIQEYFSPQVHFYSEREMVEKDYPIEDIYDGPLLKNGILPDSELRQMTTEVDQYRLIDAITSATHVLQVKKLSIHGQKEGAHSIKLNSNSYPTLDPISLFNSIKLYVGEYKLTVSKNEFLELLNKSLMLKKFKTHKTRHTEDSKYISGGGFKELGEYTSIQENFPHIYGLGKYGVFANESTDKKAKVKQLRAYVFFYEQILANFLAQLANVSNYFSLDLDNEAKHTFYHKALYDNRGANEIIGGTVDNDEWKKYKDNFKNPYLSSLLNGQETDSVYRQRKHKVFEHIYARFNELFVNYPINAFINTYGELDESRTGLSLKWKADILKNLIETEYNRIKGSNYLDESTSLGGFEKKIMRLLYIKDERKKSLLSSFNADKISLKKNIIDNSATHETIKLNFEGEELEILKDNYFQKSGRIATENQNELFLFKKEGISVLKYGINSDNYRIITIPENQNEILLIYKMPVKRVWKLVSKFKSHAEASKGLENLINYLKELSINSEGFHVVEHMLLCPPLNAESFGFRFLIGENQVGFSNERWFSFSERELHISNIITDAIGYNVINKLEQINEVIETRTHNLNSEKFKEDLKIFASNKTKRFPFFEMLVKDDFGNIIKESFFDSQVSVILPSWPARFQDPEFKTFVEGFFNSLAPAHLCFNFQWLGIQKMHDFEGVYFDWINSLKDSVKNFEVASKLSELVGSKNYFLKNY
jgi:hypothetical protein